jgi:hypothetical protein
MRYIGLDLALTTAHKAVVIDEQAQAITSVLSVKTSAAALEHLFQCAREGCPGYLRHPPGFLNVKRAKVVTIMGYYAVLSRSVQKPPLPLKNARFLHTTRENSLALHVSNRV